MYLWIFSLFSIFAWGDIVLRDNGVASVAYRGGNRYRLQVCRTGESRDCEIEPDTLREWSETAFIENLYRLLGEYDFKVSNMTKVAEEFERLSRMDQNEFKDEEAEKRLKEHKDYLRYIMNRYQMVQRLLAYLDTSKSEEYDSEFYRGAHSFWLSVFYPIRTDDEGWIYEIRFSAEHFVTSIHQYSAQNGASRTIVPYGRFTKWKDESRFCGSSAVNAEYSYTWGKRGSNESSVSTDTPKIDEKLVEPSALRDLDIISINVLCRPNFRQIRDYVDLIVKKLRTRS